MKPVTPRATTSFNWRSIDTSFWADVRLVSVLENKPIREILDEVVKKYVDEKKRAHGRV